MVVNYVNMNIKSDFPIFNNRNLVYMDNASTTQKPKVVLDAEIEFYTNYCANIHRGIYKISELATIKYSDTRKKVSEFMSELFQTKYSSDEIIFTNNTTDSINKFAFGLIDYLSNGGIILLSDLEHNSNLLPWYRLAELNSKIEIIKIPLKKYSLDFEWFKEFVDSRHDEIKVISITGMSNVIGEMININKYIELSREYSIPIHIDGAQLIAHQWMHNNKLLKPTAISYSAHKIMGPTGVGVLAVDKEFSQNLKPIFLGGGTISEISDNDYSLVEFCESFDAGTPNIAGVVGLKASLEYILRLRENARESFTNRIHEIILDLKVGLSKIDGIEVINDINDSCIVTFRHRSVHSHDIAQILADDDICIRAGMHCAHIFHHRNDLTNTVRVSPYIYNDLNDSQRLLSMLSSGIKYYL